MMRLRGCRWTCIDCMETPRNRALPFVRKTQAPWRATEDARCPRTGFASAVVTYRYLCERIVECAIRQGLSTRRHNVARIYRRRIDRSQRSAGNRANGKHSALKFEGGAPIAVHIERCQGALMDQCSPAGTTRCAPRLRCASATRVGGTHHDDYSGIHHCLGCTLPDRHRHRCAGDVAQVADTPRARSHAPRAREPRRMMR